MDEVLQTDFEELDAYIRGDLAAAAALDLEARLEGSGRLRRDLKNAELFVAEVDGSEEPRWLTLGVLLPLIVALVALGGATFAMIYGPPGWTTAASLVGFASWLALMAALGASLSRWRTRQVRLRNAMLAKRKRQALAMAPAASRSTTLSS